MDIIFATANKHKVKEVQAILGDSFNVITPEDLGLYEDIVESGDTLEENALIKAEYIWKNFGKICFADDSGLEIDGLEGRPGVYSARYAGEGCTFSDNVDKILKEMSSIDKRNARFRCVIALINKNKHYYFDGSVEGIILREPIGIGGFGYDPIFMPEGFKVSMAQMEENLKNSISHRAKAVNLLKEFLIKLDQN